jgi:hypothetical protein
MYDWIIEADAYRLKKLAEESESPRERLQLLMRAEQKLASLSQPQTEGVEHAS